jgi:deoxyribonuclease-4
MMRFGTAGFPLAAKGRSAADAIRTIRGLRLDAMELEFVRGVRYNRERADEARQVATDLDVALTAHAPYYINLNGADEALTRRSAEMVKEAARALRAYGGRSVAFHAGAYGSQPPESVYRKVQALVAEIVRELRKEDNWVQVRPETMGKSGQFGSLDEVLRLSKGVPGVLPCLDFAHLHARSAGKMNTVREFCEVLERVAQTLGKSALADLHLHISGIEYSAKGERRHLALKESDFNFRGWLKALKEFNAQGVVICESPIMEEDALVLKKEYLKL